VRSDAVRAVSSPAPCDADIERACARIAPQWPLDRLIAVNPWWGWLDRPFPEAAARLSAAMGSRLLMPRAWYRAQWQAGRFDIGHVRTALAHGSANGSADDVVAGLATDDAPPRRRALVTDIADATRDTVRHMRWSDFVVHHVSQLCASYFDAGQAQLKPDCGRGLYATWRDHAGRDLSPALLMGDTSIRVSARKLPTDPRATIAEAVEALGIPETQRKAYFTALLLSINGWAAWCAYARWQARLAGDDDDHIVQLLAIRIAWERLLYATADAPRWAAEMAQWPATDAQADAALASDWVAQEALEIAYQERVAAGLAARPPVPHAERRVQAVFCIDVRSEVFRRALEAASPHVRTSGFAGFFGLFIDYRPVGAPEPRPQLPGLLAPRLHAGDVGVPAELAGRRAERLRIGRAWKQFRQAPVSGFSFVEAMGLLYAGKLAGHSLGSTRPVDPPEQAGLAPREHALRKPRLLGTVDGDALSVERRAEAAAVMLRAMSMTHGFARLVAVVGHGSGNTNNPLAAALDCGACCGQTGEVNARAAAALLNDHAVRASLAERGIAIPDTTHFVAALHHTTTDDVTVFDLDELPPTHQADLQAFQGWLATAGARARAERAASLGIAGDDAEVHRAMAKRARDWSQVRPEWGLANCAAFIVAPREHSRHIDLGGRAFLHDYRWQDDPGYATLELIMTAPMVVTHWINLQYYASTVDNRRWGCGNKVLHNVVGGRIGVFEGNGGDLRIGLPMQSLHDGERFVHEPLRLSVFIEAPREALEGVIGKHAVVRQLVEHGWLHLLQFDASEGTVHRRTRGGWTAVRAAGDP
jgi:uncharacterized protein